MSMYIIDDHPLVRQAIAMLLRRMRPASKVIELEKFSELQAAIPGVEVVTIPYLDSKTTV